MFKREAIKEFFSDLFFPIMYFFQVHFKSNIPHEMVPTVDLSSVQKTHKKYDCTRFTQKHYDLIMVCHTEFIRHNETLPHKDKKTQQDLADRLNDITGLDKSVNAYARVWRGKVPRETLAPGTETFPEIRP